MALGVLATAAGVMGVGPSSGATDATDVATDTPKPTLTTWSVPDTAAPTTEPPTTEPPTTEAPSTVPPTTEPPTTEAPTTTKGGTPSTTAKARVSCPDAAVLVDLMNSGDASGTYTVTFTPDAGDPVTRIVTVEPGVDRTASLPIAPGTSGTLDIRSATEVVMDHHRISSTCATPSTSAKAAVDCAARQLAVTLTNSGSADGHYTLTWSPDGGDVVTRSVAVAAGATVVESVPVTRPVRGTVDVRSATEVVLDHHRVDEPCSSPSTSGTATFDCAAGKVVVTLRNDGDADGSYTLRFTPDGGTAASTTAAVPAHSEATFALSVTPPRSGTVDVRSGSDIVIDGRRIEVSCPTTTTAAPTTTAATSVPTSVAPATTVKRTGASTVLAYTGSDSSLVLVALGVSMFMLGLITLELRTVPVTRDRRS